jgi:hypothetical protein
MLHFTIFSLTGIELFMLSFLGVTMIIRDFVRSLYFGICRALLRSVCNWARGCFVSN